MSEAPLLRQLLAGVDVPSSNPYAAQMLNYLYVVGDPTTRRALLVDPAWAPSELLGLLTDGDWRLDGVVLTHYHADHAGGSLLGATTVPGVAELLEAADVPIHVQRDEIEWVSKGTGLGASSFVAHDGGDRVQLGRLELTLLHTPGHTPGSQCLLVEGSLLTGDTLFLNGCGRTDLPGGDADLLAGSLARLAALPPSTVVLAGHAYDDRPSAEMGELVRSNPVLVPRSTEEWRRRFS